MKLGVLINYSKGTDIAAEFKKALDMELPTCQLCVWDMDMYTGANAAAVNSAVKETGFEISGLWAGWSGPAAWNFYDGPLTLGLVPRAYRAHRLKELFAAADFAAGINVTDVITHIGFLPENPNDEDYHGAVAAVKSLAKYMEQKGQYFLFETGQETPTTMLRAFEDIGAGNLGVNFDSGNLIMYGNANAVDAAGMLGKYIRGVHCKDGEYPVCGKKLGAEKPLGQGRVDFPALIAKLKNMGYDRCLTIEREISGEQQIADIKNARDLLQELI